MGVLTLQGVSKRFGGVQAVRDVTLRVPQGEIRGLIGPNGSGKTTLINLISGMYPTDTGDIIFTGRSLGGLSPTRISQLGLLRTFQVPKLFGDMTLLENMFIPYYARHSAFIGGDRRSAHMRAQELLELAGLAHLATDKAKVLSGGQQALLQIARGFMVDDLALYLLDEPFAGVNPVIKEAINTLILSQNQSRGVTFLLISHEMEQILKLTHQVTALAEGTVIAEGTMEEMAQNPAVIEAYLGG